MGREIRRVRDPELLEAIDALPRYPFDDTVFRVVRTGRDPLQLSRNSARWDLGHFSVLYTSVEPDDAIAEINLHLSQQPVFPSLYRPRLYELDVELRKLARIDNMKILQSFGIPATNYGSVAYGRTREVGDAAAFLGFDGLLVPNARWSCANLVLIVDEIESERLSVHADHGEIDLRAWRNGALFRRATDDRATDAGEPLA